MTTSRALALSAVLVAAVSTFYGLVLDDWTGGVLVGCLLTLIAWTAVGAVQRWDAREWQLRHDATHAEDRRDLRAIRDYAEKTRVAAVQAACERSAEVTVLSDYRRDHERYHERLGHPPASVPGQRQDDGGAG